MSSSLLKTGPAFARLAARSRLANLSPRGFRSLPATSALVSHRQSVSNHNANPSWKHVSAQGSFSTIPDYSRRFAHLQTSEQAALSATDLPRLPVPKLHDTLQKYLKTVKPLVTPEEYRVTENIVRDFGAPGGMGERLQEMLEARARKTDNWLSKWWLNLAYLQSRLPLPVWSSPGILLPQQKAETLDDQLKLAAKVIAGIVDYKTLIDRRAVPQERMGKTPLDMSQYYNIFYTCRIPGQKVDKLVHYGDIQPLPTHMVVMRNNHFFHLEVYGKGGEERLSEDQLVEQLRSIVQMSETPAVPLGVITSDNRANWGAAYDALRQVPGNKAYLGSINSSICLVCLDGPNPDMSKHAPDARTVAALEMIHGCGTSGNAGNRWFDKTVQFVIGSKGQVGMTYEHSPAEGPPIANLTDHVMDVVTGKKPVPAGASAAAAYPPKRLEFKIPDAVQEAIKVAEENLNGMVRDLEMTMYSYQGYGKNFIKQYKMSPDSYIQMALQLAFYRIHGEPAATYESASTRKYLHGRTECIRSCSVESTAFCEAMLDKSSSIDDKVSLLRKAIEGHKKYVIEACDGFGVDRHLLGLKQTAIENGLDLHELYLDPGYSRSSHMRLSTSQVPARYDTVMCFGPLVPDGYGCCYNPRADSINFGLSALYTSPETHSSKLRDSLEETLDDMRDVLSASSSKL